MAAKKKQVVDKDTNQISDAVETTPAPAEAAPGTEPKDGFAAAAPTPLNKKRTPGEVIKTYLQNGLRYNRVVQDDGVTTLDIRA